MIVLNYKLFDSDNIVKAGGSDDWSTREVTVMNKCILDDMMERLEKKIKEATEDIEYLKNDIYRYSRGVAWNKQMELKRITKR